MRVENLNLVEPMGFEPTTFPVSPGRAQQLLNHAAIFPGFEFALTTNDRATRRECFCVEEFPRPAIFQGFGIVGVVVGEAPGNVLRLTDVETTGGSAL